MRATTKVLIFDRAWGLANNLAQWLNPHVSCEIVSASSLDDVKQHLAGNRIELIIADVYDYLTTLACSPDWIQYQANSPAKIIWLVQNEIQDYFRLALTYQVFHLFPKQLPIHSQEFSLLIETVLNPGMTLRPQLYFPNAIHTEHWIIQSSTDILDGYHHLTTFLTRYGCRNIEDMGTAYLEATTNAVYHACKNEFGADRYRKGQFIDRLEPDEWVMVYLWVDDYKAGVAIRDQGGNVKLSDTIYWTERQVNGSGTLDVHGRGFFLLRMLTDRFVLTVEQGKQTQVLFWNHHQPSPHNNKPLLLYDLQPQKAIHTLA